MVTETARIDFGGSRSTSTEERKGIDKKRAGKKERKKIDKRGQESSAISIDRVELCGKE